VGVSPRDKLVEWRDFPPPAALFERVDLPRKRERWPRRPQIIRATTGILRNSSVSTQLPDSVPMNTIANFIPAWNEAS
jgi:hypothetical protein